MATKYETGMTIYTEDADHCPMCGCDETECNEYCWEHGMACAEMFCLNCHGNYTIWLKPTHAVVQEPGEVE